MAHLSERVQDGESFQVKGLAPTYEAFQRIAKGLVPEAEELQHVEHHFHFCIEEQEALVLWFCGGALYQKQMELRSCRLLLNDLERAGFQVQEFN